MNLQIRGLLLLVLAIPGLSSAQTSTDADAKPIQFYDVEIAIFKNLKTPKSREFILPVSSPSKSGELLDFDSPRSVAAARKLNYNKLPKSAHRLVDIVTKLDESTRYQVLVHVAWRQPGLELGKVMPIWIRGGRIYGNEYISIDSQIELFENYSQQGSHDGSGQIQQFDEQSLEALELQALENQALGAHSGLYELEGKITVALSRYLHTYTDIVLRRPRLSAETVPSNSTQDRYLATHSADLRILNNHNMKEHRRMRSKHLHYLDSPEFSMLILITPHESIAEPVEVTSTDDG